MGMIERTNYDADLKESEERERRCRERARRKLEVFKNAIVRVKQQLVNQKISQRQSIVKPLKKTTLFKPDVNRNRVSYPYFQLLANAAKKNDVELMQIFLGPKLYELHTKFQRKLNASARSYQHLVNKIQGYFLVYELVEMQVFRHEAKNFGDYFQTTAQKKAHLKTESTLLLNLPFKEYRTRFFSKNGPMLLKSFLTDISTKDWDNLLRMIEIKHFEITAADKREFTKLVSDLLSSKKVTASQTGIVELSAMGTKEGKEEVTTEEEHFYEQLEKQVIQQERPESFQHYEEDYDHSVVKEYVLHSLTGMWDWIDLLHYLNDRFCHLSTQADTEVGCYEKLQQEYAKERQTLLSEYRKEAVRYLKDNVVKKSILSELSGQDPETIVGNILDSGIGEYPLSLWEKELFNLIEQLVENARDEELVSNHTAIFKLLLDRGFSGKSLINTLAEKKKNTWELTRWYVGSFTSLRFPCSRFRHELLNQFCKDYSQSSFVVRLFNTVPCAEDDQRRRAVICEIAHALPIGESAVMNALITAIRSPHNQSPDTQGFIRSIVKLFCQFFIDGDLAFIKQVDPQFKKLEQSVKKGPSVFQESECVGERIESHF